MSRQGKGLRDARRRGIAEDAGVRELDRVREPLFRELRVLAADKNYYRGRPPHACCTRELNQMRISPLEARAIALAFQRDRELARALPQVLERLRRVLPELRDNEERQNFDCPLLEGTRCLVHDLAKPIGCTAWHPPAPGEDFQLTAKGWRAFAERDRLNDKIYGPNWKLRVIPLWLESVLRRGGRGRAKPSQKTKPSGESAPGSTAEPAPRS
jgi:hypothetical protein